MKKSMAVTAGAFCIPSIIPASAMGRNGFVAPSDRLTMALIGSGGQGRGDMKQFLRNKEVQVVACCDVHRDQTEKAAAIVNEAYGNENIRMYEDYRVLLEKEELDTALLALPDHWHEETSGVFVTQSPHRTYYGVSPCNCARTTRAICATLSIE